MRLHFNCTKCGTTDGGTRDRLASSDVSQSDRRCAHLYVSDERGAVDNEDLTTGQRNHPLHELEACVRWLITGATSGPIVNQMERKAWVPQETVGYSEARQ